MMADGSGANLSGFDGVSEGFDGLARAAPTC